MIVKPARRCARVRPNRGRRLGEDRSMVRRLAVVVKRGGPHQIETPRIRNRIVRTDVWRQRHDCAGPPDVTDRRRSRNAIRSRRPGAADRPACPGRGHIQRGPFQGASTAMGATVAKRPSEGCSGLVEARAAREPDGEEPCGKRSGSALQRPQAAEPSCQHENSIVNIRASKRRLIFLRKAIHTNALRETAEVALRREFG